MTYTHKISSEIHQDFLNQDRTDPITGEKIEEGHTIVICAACKSAFFIESWEYLNHSHCEQSETLQEIPISKNLFLVPKEMEFLPFGFASSPTFSSNISVLRALTILLFISSPWVGVGLSNLLGNSSFGWLWFLAVLIFSGWVEWNDENPSKTNKLSTKQIETNNTELLLAINFSKKGIVLKNEKKDRHKEKLILFEDIEELKYSIKYHPSKPLSSRLFCQLKVKIVGHNTASITRYATIHRETIPEWSDFISKLPYNLRIINRDF